jgi:hypothetical protein
MSGYSWAFFSSFFHSRVKLSNAPCGSNAVSSPPRKSKPKLMRLPSPLSSEKDSTGHATPPAFLSLYPCLSGGSACWPTQALTKG